MIPSIAAWVLIVSTHVNAGAVISMQDFQTEQACQIAANWLEQRGDVNWARCLRKY